MQIEETMSGEVAILAILQPRIDLRSAGELKLAIGERGGRGLRGLVVDLTVVAFVDSSGLGALVSSLKLIGRGGELVLCGLNDTVVTLFELTRMDKVFRSFATSAEAVAALSPTPR